MPLNVEQGDRVSFTPSLIDDEKPASSQTPTFTDKVSAAFRLENLAVNLAQEAEQGAPRPQEDFDPLEHLEQGEFINAPAFAEAQSQEEMERIREDIRQERQARQTLAEGGTLSSLAATMIGAGVDLPSLVPFGGGVATSGRLLSTVGRGALRGAAEGAASNAATELALQEMQNTRTTEESVAAVLSGVPIGGAFGAAGAAIGRAARGVGRGSQEFQQTFEENLALANEATLARRDPGARPGGGTTSDSTAGAMRNQTVSDEDLRLANERTVRKFAQFGPATPVINPAAEGGSSRFASVRRATAKLVDGGLFTQGDFKGVFSGGPPVETRVKRRTQQALSETNAAVEENFAAARNKLPRENRTMTKDEFAVAIGRAMRRGDQPDQQVLRNNSEAPFIRDAAQRIRKNVINPLTNEAIRTGQLSSDIDVPTAESYLTRVFSTELINAQRPEFKRRLKDYFSRILGEEFESTRETPTEAARRRNRERTMEGEETEEDPTGEGLDAEPDPEQVAEEIRQGIRNPLTGELMELPENMDLDELVEQVVQSIEGGPTTRINQPTLPQGARGTLKDRTLNIPDENIEDFLESDPRLVMRKFVNTIVPDTELQREFFRPEVEFRGETRSPQEIEQERQQALDEAGKKLSAARGRVTRARNELMASLSEEQEAGASLVRQAISRNRDIPNDVNNQIMERLAADPLLAFDRNLVRHLRAQGFDEAADQVAQLQNGRRVRPEQQELRDRVTQAKRQEAEAAKALDETRQRVGEKTKADNRLGELEDQIATEIREEADQIIKQADSAEEAAQIAKERDREISMIQGVIQKLRGTEAGPSDPRVQGLVKVTRGLRDLNFARLLGSVVLSSIPDTGKIVFEEGIGRTHGAVLAELGNRMNRELAGQIGRKDAEAAAVAIERDMNTVVEQRFLGGDEGDENLNKLSPSPLDRFQRGTRSAANFIAQASGLNMWNNTMQRIVSRLATDRILNTADKIVEGGMDALSRREKAKFVRSIGSLEMAERIANQAARFGADEQGLRVAGIQDWTDAGAANALADAIRRDVDNTIINPGIGDTPLWATTEHGKVIAQFKRFAGATVNRILLSGIQRRDAQVFQGLSMMLGMGALSVALRDIAKDGKVEERDARQWAVSAIDRSGVGFLLFEADSIVDKFSGGNVSLQRALAGEELQRFTTRGPLSQIFGPSFSFIEQDLPNTLSAVMDDQTLTDEEAQSILRLAPGQNLFYVRALLDQATSEVLPAEEEQ